MADLGLDSIGMIQLIIECERFFGIKFNEADALKYSHEFTFKSFSEVIIHFCESDGDYVG